MRTYLISLLAALALTSCGGGNDVASSGATAVSAAAPTTTTVGTEAKVNGQVDERTGVAPVVAKMTIGATVTIGASGGPCPGIGIKACSSVTSQSQCPNYYLETARIQCAWNGSYCSDGGGSCGAPWTVYSNGGCAKSWNFNQGSLVLSIPQLNACVTALNAWVKTDPISACTALGGVIFGGDTCLG